MTTIGQLCQKLLSDSKQLELLALGNYLQNYAHPADLLNAPVMERFFRRALSFQHWQDNKMELVGAIQHFLVQTAARSGARMEVDALFKTVPSQVLTIEHLPDLKDILSRFLESDLQSGEQFRLIPVPQNRLLALILAKSGALTVRIFSNQMFIKEGRLVPLLDDLSLSYTPQLELAQGQFHHLETQNHVFCRFRLNETGCMGYMIRGYTFQRFETLRGGPPSQQASLFYPLKRIEQFFVDRATDPLYQELLASLEQASAQLAQRSLDSLRQAQIVLKKAEAAHEHIFVEDRLLGLMIRDLTRLLPGSTGETEVFGPR